MDFIIVFITVIQILLSCCAAFEHPDLAAHLLSHCQLFHSVRGSTNPLRLAAVEAFFFFNDLRSVLLATLVAENASVKK